MDRKSFIKTCGFACLGLTAMSALLEGCAPAKNISADIQGSDLLIPLSHFENDKKKEKGYLKYLVVHNDQLQFPVCVYRFSENDYSAIWMQCTHQGAELQVFGDKLQCPAHGSEFTSRGKLQSGPANSDLRTFPVLIENNHLKISLK